MRRIAIKLVVFLLLGAVVALPGCREVEQAPSEAAQGERPPSEPEHAEPVSPQPTVEITTNVDPVDSAGDRIAAVEYLKATYPINSTRHYTELTLEYPGDWPGLDSTLHECTSEQFAKLMPDTTFFVTELWAATAYEYPVVKCLVSVTGADDVFDIRDCMALDFTAPSEAFLSQFHGIDIPSQTQGAFTREIGELFAHTLHESSVRNGRSDNGRHVVEVWTSHLHWRDIVIEFNQDGVLEALHIVNPKAREQVHIWVNNESSEPNLITVKLYIDGEHVRDVVLDGPSPHHYQQFDFNLSPGDHQVRAVVSEEVFAEETVTVDRPRWIGISYWYYPESHLYGPVPPKLTLTVHDKPIPVF